jgi:hypothetical protein
VNTLPRQMVVTVPGPKGTGRNGLGDGLGRTTVSCASAGTIQETVVLATAAGAIGCGFASVVSVKTGA